MLRLLPNIERQYLDGSDYYNEFISEAFNENINKSKYVSDSFICENTLSVNNSAIVVGGDIVVKNPVTNMNNAIICSIIGDISIDSANISANGIIYAPMGTVRISGDNVNVSGSIIAQKIEINGRYNVNINKNSTVLSGLMTEVSSAVKYGEEDTNIIDIGEVYCKNFNVENDIVYAGDGIYCVKNQLLLSVKEEVPFEQVAELVNEFGASIVGFIELTNDFQIEFDRDVEISELLDIKERLAGVSYIISADLNQIIQEEENFHTNDDEWVENSYKSDTDIEWNEESRTGHNIAVEVIKLKSALIKCGVIENDDTPSDRIDTSMLYNVKIGIIDSGFDQWNEDGDLTFTVEPWNNYESLDALKHTGKNADGTDKLDFHGTACAGVMAAGFNNDIGIAGICVKNRLYGYSKNNPTNKTSKINDQMFNEKCALALLIGNNVRVISRSLGNYNTFAATLGNKNAITDLEKEAKQLEEFLRKFIAKGYDFIIVNAAGNDNDKEYYEVSEKDGSYKYGYVNVDDYLDSKEKSDEVITTVTYGSINSDADIQTIDGNPIIVDAKYSSGYAYIDDTIVRNRIVIVGAMQKRSLAIKDWYDGRMCKFSNLGDRVDICALGEGVWTCAVDGEGEGRDLDNGTKSEYREGKGTSIATPQVAGALGLAYSVDPSMNCLHLVNVLKRKYTDYHKDNGFQIKYVNAEELVSYAQRYHKIYGTPRIMNNISDGLIIGSVSDSSTKMTLHGVNVGVQKLNENGISEVYNFEKIHAITDDYGVFTLNLPAGDYKIILQKEGYKSEYVYVTVESESTTYIERIYLTVSNSEDGKYFPIIGRVIDAVTGLPIENAEIKYMEGWDNRNGKSVKWVMSLEQISKSDKDGNYVAFLPTGLYTAQVTREGYFTTYVNILVAQNDSPEDYIQYCVMTPVLNENEYRVVLTWGELPSDLDSHLIGELKGNAIHVSYSWKEVYQGEKIIASLDYDDTTGYGPETITFTISGNADCVKYYVHDYSNKENNGSYALSYSNAKVMVYGGIYTSEPKVYCIPIGKSGTIWNVFEIKNSKIVDIDRIE